MTNLIQIKQSTTYPDLTVHKYKRKVFYNNLWHTDPRLLESRGHVYYGDKLVVNPPTKVFNYGENGTTIDLNEDVVVVEKINGFLACATWVPEVNDVVVSTTGSLDSDYVQMARDMMLYAIEQIRQMETEYTYFFEICHPSDPHIIPENIGVYLLGRRHRVETEPYHSTPFTQDILDTLAKEIFRVSRPSWYQTKFNEVLDRVKSCKHEGYMVYGQTSKTTLKLKSPYYLTLKAIARKKDILSLNRKRVDEEYYPLLEHLISLGDSFNSMSEQNRLTYIRNYLYSG